MAWYSSNSGNKTHQAGQKRANGLGIYDMSGNVWEWVADWYGSYGSSSENNPKGPFSGSGRVIRGGGWDSFAVYVRAAHRNFNVPGKRVGLLGFRLARTR